MPNEFNIHFWVFYRRLVFFFVYFYAYVNGRVVTLICVLVNSCLICLQYFSRKQFIDKRQLCQLCCFLFILQQRSVEFIRNTQPTELLLTTNLLILYSFCSQFFTLFLFPSRKQKVNRFFFSFSVCLHWFKFMCYSQQFLCCPFSGENCRNYFVLFE